MIGFNKPYLTGKEISYIQQAVLLEKLSGNGFFTKKCQEFFTERYGFKKTLLTHSCTAALEMAALLIDIKPGDEVIMPSYTFVSTANAFLLRGASIIFADSNPINPNIDIKHIAKLVTPNTKAIVVVHYAGIACDMDAIMELAAANGIYVIEDAAQAVDSFHKDKPLGSIGHLSAFSFHETKNIIAGEGGMLVINDKRFIERSEILWEKGTNRVAFSRNEVNKYNWVDIGSSFLPSELTAAFLWAQLECLDEIQDRRKKIWRQYYDRLKILDEKSLVKLPALDTFATNNAHMFYLITNNAAERSKLISFMKENDVQCIFHYLPLHESPYFTTHHNKGKTEQLENTQRYGSCLVRLPLYFELTDDQLTIVTNHILSFYGVGLAESS